MLTSDHRTTRLDRQDTTRRHVLPRCHGDLMKRACYSFHKVCLFIPGAHHHKSRRKNCTRNKKSSEQSEVFWLFELDDHRPFYVYPLCYLTVQSGPVIFVFHKYCIIQPTSPASNTLFFPLSPNSSCSFARARARSLSLSLCVLWLLNVYENILLMSPRILA